MMFHYIAKGLTCELCRGACALKVARPSEPHGLLVDSDGGGNWVMS